MIRHRRPVAALAAIALLATACSGGDDDTADGAEAEPSPSTTDADAVPTTSTTSSTTTTVPPSTTTTTTIPDVLRMPLTGEPIDEADEIPDRPALAVKISNAPLGRVMPQSGLNQADIVIEEIINDAATRLAAVFHSQDMDPVGPIRSGRAQDVPLLLSLQKPLFAWSGGNASVTRAIRESDLVDLANGRASGFYRRSGRQNPNDLYSTTEALWEQDTDDTGRPIPLFFYVRPGETIEGASAARIEIQLDSLRAVWEYDADADHYVRTQNGIEHNTETPDGVERVTATNVVVMLADYGINTFDGNPDAQVLGSNPVLVFTNGKVQIGEWLRFMPEEPFQFFDNFDDLNPLPVQPGRTWMEIPRNLDGVVEWFDDADEAFTNVDGVAASPDALDDEG